jgi:hypothetical protein
MYHTDLTGIIQSRLPVSRKIHTRLTIAIMEMTIMVIRPALPNPPNASFVALTVELTSNEFGIPAIIRPPID